MTDLEQIEPGRWPAGSPESPRVEMARDATAEPCANMCEKSRRGRTLLITCDQGPSIQSMSDHVCLPISPA
jgi:hypothetical protein